MAAILAVFAAVLIGTSDYLAAVAARVVRPAAVAAASQVAAFVGLLVIAPRFGGSLDRSGAFWGAGSGLAFAAGDVLFLEALKIEQMGEVTALTALAAAVLPVVVGIALGDRPAATSALGVIAALGAMLLLTYSPAQPGRKFSLSRARILSLAAGASFGVYLVLLSRTAPATGLWPLCVLMGTSAALLMVVSRARGGSLAVRRKSILAVAGAGLLYVAALAAYLVAIRNGLFSLVTVITSLYPGVTVFWAWLLLKERMTRVQAWGFASAGLAVALIAAHGGTS